MRAVNLIPAEARRGAGGAAGRSGGVVYVLLGGLVVLVVMVAVYAIASKQVSDRNAQLARTSQEADAAQARANALAPYTQFASLRQTRVQTVTSLASGRFDWAHAMHEIGRVLPRDVFLNTLTGTIVAPSSSSTGSSGAAVAANAAAPIPQIVLTGCSNSNSQSEVALTLVRLRLIDGVTKVSLTSSSKDASTGSGAAQTVCLPHVPNFTLTIVFAPMNSPSAGSSSSGSPATPATPGAPSTANPTQAAQKAVGTSNGTSATPSATSTTPAGASPAPATPVATPAAGNGSMR